MRIFCLACLLFFSIISVAQTKEGTIIYERKINMHKRIQDENMKAMIPEFRTTKHQLLFSDSVSMYKTVPEEEQPDAMHEEGGARVIVRMGGPGENSEQYKNFAEGKAIQAMEMGARNLLIEDSIKPRKWKLTGETKQILGYTCRKAISTETIMMGGGTRIMMGGAGGQASTDTANKPKAQEVTVEAWFAEGINSPAGPDSYGLLPGVILELNVDNGSMIYQAKEVKTTVNAADIKEPKKGKRVTRQEYNNMMMEMMKNSGGNRMIRM
jgi:GLPGLI family protein